MLIGATVASAQERPYFVTYDHHLEGRGSLEAAMATITGIPKDGAATYTAPWFELEYGVRNWWTTELYLEGVTTAREGSGFTGWRWENRVRPLRGEHRLNPVLYVEYERVNEASRIQKEIVGDGRLPFGPIAALRPTTANEIEGKLILSSGEHDWNIAENFTVEKNLSANEGYEFGYSIGVSRGLGADPGTSRCRLVCRENFVAGVEAFGGLGSSKDLTIQGARHYLAPGLFWRLADYGSIKASVAFGLTVPSDHALIRLGYTFEFGKEDEGG
jgi:hypothetical protein